MEENEWKPVEPYNPTDPVVKMDPEIEKTHIVLPYQATESNDEGGFISHPFGAQTRFDAIKIPLVQINQVKLRDNQIETVEITIAKFLPELYLKFKDENDYMSKINAPGMTSTVTVIMAAPIEGVSKKISLCFYVTAAETATDGTIEILGEMSIPAMNQVKNMQIGSDKMTTYEFLKQIAQDCKLGFAATEKCEDVQDKRWRQVYSQTFKDYIEDQISFGGLDNNSVFDAWVDQFGYLVMVNLPYVMSENIDANQLTMRIVKGSLFNDKKDMVAEQKYEEVVRLLTNARNVPGDSNGKFGRWSNEVDNDLIKDTGTANKYYYMTGIGDTNTIATEELEITEPSVDGQSNSETCKFDKVEFLGFEMDEDSPVLVQKKIVKRLKAMMGYKQIFIEMEKPNYFLQRGTLVNMDFEDYDMETKKAIIANNANITAGGKTDDIIGEQLDLGDDNANVKNALLNEQMSFTNLALSGMYYINDMSFKYDKAFDGIVQCMHLVKRGTRTNIINESTPINTLS